ncbi:MAG: serine hydrolase domain-containing protein [bacterium]
MDRLDPDVVRSAGDYLRTWLPFRQRYLRVPGLQAALMHGDTLELELACGFADIAGDVALHTDHRFRVASHSKMFTATAIMVLWDAGRLRLDDRVADHVRALAGSPVADVTLRELLSHAGGVIRDGDSADFWQLQGHFLTEAELLRVAREEGAVTEANQRFKYSNIGYGLLGLVIEAVTGGSYADVVTGTVVTPLRLSATGPEPGPDVDLATGYSALAYADERVPIAHFDTRAMAAATGFYSTAGDLVRFAAAHFDDAPSVLSAAARRQMRHAWWEVPHVPDQRYGFGLDVVKVGERSTVGHGGGYPGHITRTLWDPTAGLAVSVLTNAIDGPAAELARGMVRTVDLAAAQEADPGLSAQAAASFSGRYANLWGVLDVVALGGRLLGVDPTLSHPGEAYRTLTMVDDSTLSITDDVGFGAAGEQMTFRRRPDGSVEEVHGGGGLTWWPIEQFSLPSEGVRAPVAEPHHRAD